MGKVYFNTAINSFPLLLKSRSGEDDFLLLESRLVLVMCRLKTHIGNDTHSFHAHLLECLTWGHSLWTQMPCCEKLRSPRDIIFGDVTSPLGLPAYSQHQLTDTQVTHPWHWQRLLKPRFTEPSSRVGFHHGPILLDPHSAAIARLLLSQFGENPSTFWFLMACDI